MLVDGTPCWASSAPASLRSSCVPRRSEQGQLVAARAPLDYAAFVAYLAQRYGDHLAAIEVWNEPDQANELYFAGPHKAERYAALLTAAYPAIKQADPRVHGARGLARRLQRSVPARAVRRRHQGLLRRARGPLLHAHARRAARDPRSAARQRRHDAAVARRVRLEQLLAARRSSRNRRASRAARRRRTSATSSARSRTRPYVAAAVVFKLQDSSGEDFGVLTAARRAQALLRALCAACSSHRSGSPSRVTLSLRSARRRRRGQRLGTGRRLHAAGSPSARRPALPRDCSRSTASTATRWRCPRVLGTQRPAGAGLSALDGHRPRRQQEHLSERRAPTPARHSALRSSATNVSARIFTSRPSDQLAM